MKKIVRDFDLKFWGLPESFNFNDLLIRPTTNQKSRKRKENIIENERIFINIIFLEAYCP